MLLRDGERGGEFRGNAGHPRSDSCAGTQTVLMMPPMSPLGSEPIALKVASWTVRRSCGRRANEVGGCPSVSA